MKSPKTAVQLTVETLLKFTTLSPAQAEFAARDFRTFEGSAMADAKSRFAYGIKEATKDTLAYATLVESREQSDIPVSPLLRFGTVIQAAAALGAKHGVAIRVSPPKIGRAHV